MKWAIVSLCVNDERGSLNGHVSSAHFEMTHSGMPRDTLLELDSPWWFDDEDDEINPHPSFEFVDGHIVVGGKPYPTHGLKEMYGNVFWNAYAMMPKYANRLARDLRETHRFHVDAWVDGQPFLPVAFLQDSLAPDKAQLENADAHPAPPGASVSERVAGRELDAEIAHKIMGLVPCAAWRYENMGSAGGPVSMNSGCEHGLSGCYPSDETLPFSGPPRYSTDIKAAWSVVEKLNERGLDVSFVVGSGRTSVMILQSDTNYVVWMEDASPSAPLAICLAALAAVSPTQEKP